jgi:hypothetical protein
LKIQGETKDFLEAVRNFYFPTKRDVGYGIKTPSTISQVIKQIREKFLEISHKQLIACFPEQDLASIANIVIILCGARQNEDTKRCVKVFDRLAKFVDSAPASSDNPKECMRALIPYQWISHLVSLGIIGITFTWHNFLLAAQGDAEAKIVLKRVMRLYHLVGKFRIEAFSSFGIEKGATKNLNKIEKEFYTEDGVFLLYIPDESLAFANEVFKEVKKEILEEQKKVIELLEWFCNNFDEFSTEYNEMWQEIQEHPHYMLRPDGLDKVKIEIDALRPPYLRFHLLQLFPLTEFPSARAKFG